MLGWMGRAALEMIGQGGLGYSLDPLVSDNVNEYGRALKSLSYVLTVCSRTHKEAHFVLQTRAFCSQVLPPPARHDAGHGPCVAAPRANRYISPRDGRTHGEGDHRYYGPQLACDLQLEEGSAC